MKVLYFDSKFEFTTHEVPSFIKKADYKFMTFTRDPSRKDGEKENRPVLVIDINFSFLLLYIMGYGTVFEANYYITQGKSKAVWGSVVPNFESYACCGSTSVLQSGRLCAIRADE